MHRYKQPGLPGARSPSEAHDCRTPPPCRALRAPSAAAASASGNREHDRFLPLGSAPCEHSTLVVRPRLIGAQGRGADRGDDGSADAASVPLAHVCGCASIQHTRSSCGRASCPLAVCSPATRGTSAPASVPLPPLRRHSRRGAPSRVHPWRGAMGPPAGCFLASCMRWCSSCRPVCAISRARRHGPIPRSGC